MVRKETHFPASRAKMYTFHLALPLSEPMAHMCSSMEMLLKYTEAQRHLLNDMMTNMSIASGHKVLSQPASRKGSHDGDAEQQQHRRPR